MTEILGVPRKWGRKVEHDPRSRAYGIVVNPNVEIKTVLYANDAPVLDQGDLGSCTGNAMSQWINTHRTAQKDSSWLTEEDAVAIYSAATVIDEFEGSYPPDDTGSSGLAVAKVAKQKNYITSYKHAFGFDAMLQALQTAPVIVGTVWFSNMNTPDENAVIRASGDELGGHEYLILGCDIDTRLITILNSWSSSWGSDGRAHISFDDFRKLLEANGDVTVPIG